MRAKEEVRVAKGGAPASAGGGAPQARNTLRLNHVIRAVGPAFTAHIARLSAKIVPKVLLKVLHLPSLSAMSIVTLMRAVLATVTTPVAVATVTPVATTVMPVAATVKAVSTTVTVVATILT